MNMKDVWLGGILFQPVEVSSNYCIHSIWSIGLMPLWTSLTIVRKDALALYASQAVVLEGSIPHLVDCCSDAYG
jgi:hypothetical protein